MKKILTTLAIAAVAQVAHADDVYVGAGLPNIYTVGYAKHVNTHWGWRAEYGGGLSLSKDGEDTEGVIANVSLKASRLGAFADWFPFEGNFRMVGGLTHNNIKAEYKAIGSGTSTINGKPVNMNGQTYNVTVKYPTITPYLGIGWGHHLKPNESGLGFYTDIGVSVGKFKSSVETSLVGFNGGIPGAPAQITQADVDAQNKKMQDALNKLSVLPSFSMGLVYRF